jgi:hypothetical protein
MKGRWLSDFRKLDTVRTASGRLGIVRGFDGDGVVVQTNDGEEMALLPTLLEVISPAPRHVFPVGFFAGEGHAKGAIR